MRYFIFLMIAVALSSGAEAKKPKPKAKPTPAKTEIQQLLSNQQKAWNDGKIEVYMQGYWKSDSLTFVGKRGVTKGWKNTLENYKKSYPDKTAMGKLDMQILSLKLLTKDMAFVVGKWDLTRSAGNVGGHFTLLLRKLNGKWVIVADHSS